MTFLLQADNVCEFVTRKRKSLLNNRKGRDLWQARSKVPRGFFYFLQRSGRQELNKEITHCIPNIFTSKEGTCASEWKQNKRKHWVRSKVWEEIEVEVSERIVVKRQVLPRISTERFDYTRMYVLYEYPVFPCCSWLLPACIVPKSMVSTPWYCMLVLDYAGCKASNLLTKFI